MSRKPKYDSPADEPLLRRSRRLTLEAHRVGAAAATERGSAQTERIAALVAELSDVHRAMIDGREEIRREADTAIRHTAAATAYARAAKTLKTRRPRP